MIPFKIVGDGPHRIMETGSLPGQKFYELRTPEDLEFEQASRPAVTPQGVDDPATPKGVPTVPEDGAQ